jgi:UDP-hydrolysing UDP-N-acetyl-D-glucosamine 2-epimerase
MHLSAEFGSTWKEIEKDGFQISAKVDILVPEDSNLAMAQSTGQGVSKLAETFSSLKPDWIVLLGDRFEIFAAASAAHMLKIPIAHLHGGELSEGALDDAFRHAITKMAWLHFTSTEVYRKRVIQLGEDPKRVFNVGAIGLDNIKGHTLLKKKELQESLSVDGIDDSLLITYHPVTLEDQSGEGQFKQLLDALKKFPDHKLIFTLPNADAGGRNIIKLIEEYVEKNGDRAKAFPSLGQLRYLSLLQYAEVMVGNSSSGIIEAPAFGLPTVNIGNRQNGRLKPKSVIDSPADKKNIERALHKALSNSFKKSCRKMKHPYGEGKAAGKILKQIKKFGKLSQTQKRFYDLRHA